MQFKHPSVRRTAALLAVPALALSALAVSPAPASAAAGTDPAPATAAGTWLYGQLTDGLVHNQQYDFDDYGLTIDAGLALHAVGAPEAAVDAISDAIAANIDAYVAPGYGTNLSAGGTAKALVLATAAGADPASYGGRDLVTDLEGRVATDGAIAGRIQDDWDASDPYGADYANVLGQAYAVEGLDAVDSSRTDSATDFLLEQQCSSGFFRLNLSTADAADQTCDGSDGQPSVDATAIAVEALQSQVDDTDVAAHVDAAIAWLESQQNDDGSFGSDADIPAGNANSTGLAGYALLLGDRTGAAARSASWLRAHQATNVANCVYYDASDVGAVVYDDAALTAAQGGAMDAAALDQSVRATAQALPALLAAPAADGDANVLFTAEYVKAGGKKPVGVTGAAPGEALCAMLGEQSVLGYADGDGEAELAVLIPKKTATSKVKVANATGKIGSAEINALGAKKLKVSLAAKVKKGTKQTIKVTGLAPGESVTVSVTWPSTGHGGSGSGSGGQANGKGVYTTSLKAQSPTGKAKVKVVGQFKNRKASTTFVITK